MSQTENGISEADEIKVQKIPNKVYEAELYRLQGELSQPRGKRFHIRSNHR